MRKTAVRASKTEIDDGYGRAWNWRVVRRRRGQATWLEIACVTYDQGRTVICYPWPAMVTGRGGPESDEIAVLKQTLKRMALALERDVVDEADLMPPVGGGRE